MLTIQDLSFNNHASRSPDRRQGHQAAVKNRGEVSEASTSRYAANEKRLLG